MRMISSLLKDIKHQFSYKFYFVYLIVSIMYIVIIYLIPNTFKANVTSMIILSDPVTLGIFFSGSIWLLEKNENVIHYLRISPLKPQEYVLSKIISLALISTISSLIIVLFSLTSIYSIFILSISIFMFSLIFTLIGIAVSSYSRSFNHFLLLVLPPSIILVLPGILYAIHVDPLILNFFPSTTLFKLIQYSILGNSSLNILDVIFPLLWFITLYYFASMRAYVIKSE